MTKASVPPKHFSMTSTSNHGVEIRIVRIFNTYGPRMRPDDGRVVSNFIVQALKGEDITVYGDGSQTRSFCYVDDLIEGFHRLMYSPRAFTRRSIIGNPSEFTVRRTGRADCRHDRLAIQDRLSPSAYR